MLNFWVCLFVTCCIVVIYELFKLPDQVVGCVEVCPSQGGACFQSMHGTSTKKQLHVLTIACRLSPELPIQGAAQRMQPKDIQVIGEELAIKWEDGEESFLPLAKLRAWCPCAACKGEVDIMGNLSKGPNISLTAASAQLVKLDLVGGYAIQPKWADGHGSGIFSYDYLRKVADAPDPV